MLRELMSKRQELSVEGMAFEHEYACGKSARRGEGATGKAKSPRGSSARKAGDTTQATLSNSRSTS